MTFFDFIARYRGEQSPLGDLARDIYLDDNFPTEATDPDVIQEYFSRIYGKADGFEMAISKALDYFKREV
ncbi:hypothetical protein X560_0406 [Listeria fleischmannii 1991]|jgi:uncharacterized protein YozE (UPF0346 family)|uniref:Protein of uncharacterized function (DUF1250) n=2 Tax=Listeria fleischmannii TaxID=1069827 RepID=A0A2X3J071_9LIST|nr:YozE family protein [Listeria fleischmannii]EMG27510.1 hypothetical protein LFLEISCH_10744 [Listeria fleischmannii subsp. fleischmannii LU2006-1]KMT60986.1 hypothetical protein X560_0406 [Listeria fleischmannii 1991]SQC67340.1 Protein of uncharacterised function (DUF1250) [Listeria fleischmannii subsp. fleischmannii]